MQTTHDNITTEAEFDQLLAQVGVASVCVKHLRAPVCMATCKQRRRQVGILQTPSAHTRAHEVPLRPTPAGGVAPELVGREDQAE